MTQLFAILSLHSIGMLFVFLMQTGFAMLEVGSVNEKNTQNILMKVGFFCFKNGHIELLAVSHASACPHLF